MCTTMPHIRTRLWLLALGALSGCTPVGPTIDDEPAELAFCADEVNRYRAHVSLPPLEQSSALETYAAESARVDGSTGQPHAHFLQTNGGGVALAETELLGWSNLDVRAVIGRGLKLMWEEGPTGEHYPILVGPYSQIGCGVFVGNKRVTVTQSFR